MDITIIISTVVIVVVVIVAAMLVEPVMDIYNWLLDKLHDWLEEH